MVQTGYNATKPRLTGSQAATLLQQGTLGAELIKRAKARTEEARTDSIPFPADQADALRRALIAPRPDDFGGDAA